MDEKRLQEIEAKFKAFGVSTLLESDIPDLLAEVKKLRGLLTRVLVEGQIAFDLRLEIEDARK